MWIFPLEGSSISVKSSTKVVFPDPLFPIIPNERELDKFILKLFIIFFLESLKEKFKSLVWMERLPFE